jgi:hypothetical protein
MEPVRGGCHVNEWMMEIMDDKMNEWMMEIMVREMDGNAWWDRMLKGWRECTRTKEEERKS